MLLNQILAFTMHEKNIKKSCKSNKFEISVPTWNNELELPDRLYFVSDIQIIFKYLKKAWRKD